MTPNTPDLGILSRPCDPGAIEGPWAISTARDITQACGAMRRARVPTLFRVWQGPLALFAVAAEHGTLSVLDAPPWRFSAEAAAWSATRDWFAAWEDTDNASWMLGALADVDPRAAVRASAALVRLYPPKNPHALAALDTCDAWLDGKVSNRRMQRAHAVAMAEGRRHLDARRRVETERAPRSIFAPGNFLDSLLPALDAMNHDSEALAVTHVGLIAAMCRQLSSDDAPKPRSLAPVPTNVDGLPLSYEMNLSFSVQSLPEQILQSHRLADRDAGRDWTDDRRNEETVATLHRTVSDVALARYLFAAARRKGCVTDEQLYAMAAERAGAVPAVGPLAV